ncbi:MULTISPECIES: alpha/beta family hydrolase [unclassified Streptomyces]|uniref:alpha/beta hydrolase family protein n=1 Tax=unclassified Streptomyces TaxID=2593676 RepID=UPI000F6E0042|nr:MULTISPECIES: alpha/beta family hydrolase [unclassified Streptomyces]AZM60112.1 hydrolase [Streptomyces sp. WAC 01438]RSM99874.1 hydrolase [Streptomyces sp. WAC 01420]
MTPDTTETPGTTSTTGTTDTAGTAQTVETDAGPARVTWHRAAPPARLVLALSHGAGGGIGARDLQALAAELPAHGVTVALVEQPWRVAGKKVAPAPKTLDTGWQGVWPALTGPGLPVIAGGRSAGARVACRTARELGAHAVLALSFPLHPPGKPEKSRADELLEAGVPTLVVQGGNDPFGRPPEFPEGAYELVEVPHGDHGLAVPKRAGLTQEEAVAVVTDAVVRWTGTLG